MNKKRTYGSGALFKDNKGYWISRVKFTDSNGKIKNKVFKSKDKKVVSTKLKEF